jgi:hypothetical protein
MPEAAFVAAAVASRMPSRTANLICAPWLKDEELELDDEESDEPPSSCRAENTNPYPNVTKDPKAHVCQNIALPCPPFRGQLRP